MLLNPWMYKSYPSLCKVPSPEPTLAFLPSREQWHGRFFCSLPSHYPSRWPKGVSVLQGHSILFQLGYLTPVPQLPHFLRSIFVNFFWEVSPPNLLSVVCFWGDRTGVSVCEGKMLPKGVSQGKQSEQEESALQMGERQILPLAGSLVTRMTWAGSPGTHCCHHVGRTWQTVVPCRPRNEHGSCQDDTSLGCEGRRDRRGEHVVWDPHAWDGGEESMPEGISGKLIGCWDV